MILSRSRGGRRPRGRVRRRRAVRRRRDPSKRMPRSRPRRRAPGRRARRARRRTRGVLALVIEHALVADRVERHALARRDLEHRRIARARQASPQHGRRWRGGSGRREGAVRLGIGKVRGRCGRRWRARRAPSRRCGLRWPSPSTPAPVAQVPVPSTARDRGGGGGHAGTTVGAGRISRPSRSVTGAPRRYADTPRSQVSRTTPTSVLPCHGDRPIAVLEAGGIHDERLVGGEGDEVSGAPGAITPRPSRPAMRAGPVVRSGSSDSKARPPRARSCARPTVRSAAPRCLPHARPKSGGHELDGRGRVVADDRRRSSRRSPRPTAGRGCRRRGWAGQHLKAPAAVGHRLGVEREVMRAGLDRQSHALGLRRADGGERPSVRDVHDVRACPGAPSCGDDALDRARSPHRAGCARVAVARTQRAVGVQVSDLRRDDQQPVNTASSARQRSS